MKPGVPVNLDVLTIDSDRCMNLAVPKSAMYGWKVFGSKRTHSNFESCLPVQPQFLTFIKVLEKARM